MYMKLYRNSIRQASVYNFLQMGRQELTELKEYAQVVTDAACVYCSPQTACSARGGHLGTMSC